MKIAVFGSTGLTGRLVTEQALANGHEVAALVRNPDTVQLRHPSLTVRKGSPTSASDVEACVAGSDVVIHCLGVGGKGDGKYTTLISDSVKAALAAMRKHGVRRIVCMSNVGAGGSGPWLVHRLVVPIFLRWLRPIVEDKDRMEAALRASDVEWVSVRLVGIVEGPAKPVRVSDNGRGIGLTVTAHSVAKFLLERTQGPEFVGSTPALSN
jgi:uncharacterized protein YbjT (DUF2867 family)